MSRQEELEELARKAKALQDAARALEEFKSVGGDMVDDEKFSEDEGNEIVEDLETAERVCKELSVSMVMALAQEGYVPDFDALEDDEDESDGGHSSGAAFM